ncbi:MAG: DNA repair protein RecN [Ferrimicrobium sp.]
MLDTLVVSNLGVIAEAVVEFEPGLVVITGETGAGKTLLTSAIGLLLGDRAHAETIGPIADLARVEGIFRDEEDETIITREISLTGRSRARLNGELVPLATVSSFTERLVQLYGQHLSVRLTRPVEQLRAIDRYGGCDPTPYVRLHQRIRLLEGELGSLKHASEDNVRQQSLLAYELAEMDAANLEDPSEDEAIRVEMELLSSVAERRNALEGLHRLIMTDDGVADRLSRAVKLLESAGDVGDLDRRVGAVVDELNDVATDARHASELLEEDPERLSILEARQAELLRLKRRFGQTLMEVIEARSERRSQLDELSSYEDRRVAIESELEELSIDCEAAYAALALARTEAAKRLESVLHATLASVALEHAVLQITVEGLQPSILFSANPGFALAPLERVASGGELSRLMLALASVVDTEVPTVIFDEVDSGIGGAAALKIAEALRQLSRSKQVLVVTHLPQIAAASDQHIIVTKMVAHNSTQTAVATIHGQDRIAEIARMLSGQPSSATAQQHALELVEALTGEAPR